MAYNKKIWGSDEVITKEALNNIENGIEAVEQSIPKLVSQLTNDAGYITEHLDLSNYAEKDELHEHNNKDVLDGINLVRMQSWDNAASKGDINLDDYALKDDLHEHSNLDILEQIDQNKINEWNSRESFSGDYNDLENKPTIPEKLSELENDTNFLTEHQSLEDYALKSEIPTIPDCTITEEEKQEMDNRVKALEEVEHISLEQYNALLDRIVLLEEALAALKQEEPDVPEDPVDPGKENPDEPEEPIE